MLRGYFILPHPVRKLQFSCLNFVANSTMHGRT